MISLGGVFAMYEKEDELSPELSEIYNTFIKNPEADLKLQKDVEWYGPVISDYQNKKNKPYMNLGWITDYLTIKHYVKIHPEKCTFSILLNLGMFDYAKLEFKGTFYLVKNYIPMRDKIRFLLELQVPLINIYINATSAGDRSIIDYFNEVYPKNIHNHNTLILGSTENNWFLFECYFLTTLNLWLQNGKEPKSSKAFDIFEYYLSHEKPIYTNNDSKENQDHLVMLDKFTKNHIDSETMLSYLKIYECDHFIYEKIIMLALERNDEQLAKYCFQQKVLLNTYYIFLCAKNKNIQMIEYMLHVFMFQKANLIDIIEQLDSNQIQTLLKNVIETKQCYE